MADQPTEKGKLGLGTIEANAWIAQICSLPLGYCDAQTPGIEKRCNRMSWHDET